MKKLLFVLLVVFGFSSCLNKDAIKTLKVENDSLQAVINSHVPTICDTTIVKNVTVYKTITTYDQDTIWVQDTIVVNDTNWVNLWIEIPDTVVVTVYDTIKVVEPPHKCHHKK
jgi:hypothetical protein